MRFGCGHAARSSCLHVVHSPQQVQRRNREQTKTDHRVDVKESDVDTRQVIWPYE